SVSDRAGRHTGRLPGRNGGAEGRDESDDHRPVRLSGVRRQSLLHAPVGAALVDHRCEAARSGAPEAALTSRRSRTESPMSEVAYTSKIKLERRKGPLRIAYLPGESQPVTFSVHGAIAEHYKIDPASLTESHAATIDYLIAATAGCMLGTFGGALEARQIDASGGRLTADVTGEVETEDGVLVIRRIHVAMQLVASDDVRPTVERVHGVYAMRCPLYRTLHQAIALSSSIEVSV